MISKLSDRIIGARDMLIHRTQLSFPTNIQGMSSVKTQLFPHLLTSLGSSNYLEVGTFRGSTFVPAMMGRSDVRGTAIDNWSYPGSSRIEFEKNLLQYVGPTWLERVNILDGDWRAVDLSLVRGVDLYLYDGDHSYEAHADALTVVKECLASEFIFLVDDYNHRTVRRATDQALADFDVVFSLELGDGIHRDSGSGDTNGWWNGYFAAHLRKR